MADSTSVGSGADQGGEQSATIERLRETAEMFRQITELVPQVFWIFTPDFSRTIYVSPAYEALWGRPLEGVYRDTSEFIRAVHPEDLDRLYRAMSQVQHTEYPGVEYRVIQPDGSIRWARSRGYPVTDERGEIYRIVGITEDITQRKLLEAETASASERYARIVRNAPYAIYALDREGRFTDVNPAGEAQLGRSADNLRGQHVSVVIAPEDHALAAESLRIKVDGKAEATELRVHLLRANGERRLVHIRATPIRENGVAIGTQGIARDITDEVERERQLRRAERLASVGTLIGGVAHELNNPLTSVISFAALLAEGDRTPEEREDLETIRREGMRAAKIVSDLRLLARQTQEEPAEKITVDLNDIVRHVLRTRRYVHETRNIAVTEDLAPDLPRVLADRHQLEQVLVNLIVNAEQAMEDGERDRAIIVRTRASGEGVAISVVDRGRGIPADQLERIFDPFFTTKGPSQGTGLGLSLVYSIIQEHRGRIGVESQVGKGTAFRIDLPVAPAHTRRSDAVPEEGPAAESLRVLIVDDEPAIRAAFSRYLSNRGHQVVTADEGADALRLLASGDGYDVIVTDLRMPGLGGDQLVARLREQGGGLEQRVIFLTGDAASGEAAKLLAKAGLPVMFKPIALADLARRVESIGRATAHR